MLQGYDPIIPNEYIILKSRDVELRPLSVRKYRTTVSFERQHILEGLEKSHLVFGTDFGVIQTYDTENPKHTIRALCGLVGEKDLVLIDQTSRLKYLRLKHVLQTTMMIEFLTDLDSGYLEFLIYGGNQGYQEFQQMLEEHFGIIEKPTELKFSDMGVRRLCEKFFEQLYQVTSKPLHQEGWGTIDVADFKSERGQFIDPFVERMQQIRKNENIIIKSFKSVLRNQRIESLGDFYNVKFSLLKDRSGINLTIPELTLPTSYSDVDYERVVYDFARYIYNQIIGQEYVYEPIPQDSQLDLFG